MPNLLAHAVPHKTNCFRFLCLSPSLTLTLALPSPLFTPSPHHYSLLEVGTFRLDASPRLCLCQESRVCASLLGGSQPMTVVLQSTQA